MQSCHTNLFLEYAPAAVYKIYSIHKDITDSNSQRVLEGAGSQILTT